MAVVYETSLAPVGVTFDAAGEAETVNFNAGTGSNRCLIVAVCWRDFTSTISGVTYNSVAMTSVGSMVTDATHNLHGHLWRLHNPASGANDIVVTMGAGTGNSVALIAAWVANGVDSSTPVDGYTTNNGSGSSANIVSSVTVSSATNDRVAVFHATFNETNNISATPTNYTERQDAGNGAGLTMEFGDADGAGSIASSATWSNGAFLVSWVALGINLNETAAVNQTEEPGVGSVVMTGRAPTLGRYSTSGIVIRKA